MNIAIDFIQFTNPYRFESDANEISFKFLIETNQNCEWIWKMYIKYVIFGFFVGIISMATISVSFSYLIKGEFDEKIAYHPYRFM